MDSSPSPCLHTTWVPSPKGPTEHQAELSWAWLGWALMQALYLQGHVIVLHIGNLKNTRSQLIAPASSQVIEKEHYVCEWDLALSEVLRMPDNDKQFPRSRPHGNCREKTNADHHRFQSGVRWGATVPAPTSSTNSHWARAKHEKGGHNPGQRQCKVSILTPEHQGQQLSLIHVKKEGRQPDQVWRFGPCQQGLTVKGSKFCSDSWILFPKGL